MIPAFSVYIKNIAIFLIFTAFANIMIPSAKYKQYVNLALGFVMIFLLLTPLRALIGAVGGDDIGAMFTGFSNRFETAVTKPGDVEKLEGAQDALILSAFKESILSQIETLVAEEGTFIYQSADITADESDEHFGEIQAIRLTLRKKTAEERAAGARPTAKPLIRIEPVAIDTQSIFSTKYEPEGADAEESDEIKNIKKLLSDFYNLSHDNIYITISDTKEKTR
jgi:hypothetical protein